MPRLDDPQALIRYLRSPQAIRDRAQELFELGLAGDLPYFQIDLGQLDRVVQFVDRITRSTYPDLQIPFHSRWRHFPDDRIVQRFDSLDPVDRIKAKLDLVIPSVLLDAGAGEQWRYVDAQGQTWQRSEGLAIACLEMFERGLWSGDGRQRTDANGLGQITLAQLQAGFQVSAKNPMLGLEGRWQMLKRLATVLEQRDFIDRSGDSPRFGNLIQARDAVDDSRSMATWIPELLKIFSPLWADGLRPTGGHRLLVAGQPIGDVGFHPALSPLVADDPNSRWIPFHKLAQWLICSLVEPFEEWQQVVRGLHCLSGLAEYRNGGLFIDFGVLKLRDPSLVAQLHSPDSVLIVEWRGLTLWLLELIRLELLDRWGMGPEELPMIKVLQGGSWAAGRAIARELRSDGGPPLRIQSDGTVF
ncbi:MAG: hypothetical protein RLZZ511_442 [Cyanobacteriota bacterium]|jgi:hypothetical protein